VYGRRSRRRRAIPPCVWCEGVLGETPVLFLRPSAGLLSLFLPLSCQARLVRVSRQILPGFLLWPQAAPGRSRMSTSFEEVLSPLPFDRPETQARVTSATSTLISLLGLPSRSRFFRFLGPRGYPGPRPPLTRPAVPPLAAPPDRRSPRFPPPGAVFLGRFFFLIPFFKISPCDPSFIGPASSL